jgi:Kef-type K+ transport system membrane component KefB
MFVIGMELDIKVLKTKLVKCCDVMLVSSFLFCVGIICLILCLTDLPEGFSFLLVCLWVHEHNCLPVLARIVQEREIHKTKLGAIVITCAAADDYGLVPLVVIAIVKEILSARYMLFRSLQFMCW